MTSGATLWAMRLDAAATLPWAAAAAALLLATGKIWSLRAAAGSGSVR